MMINNNNQHCPIVYAKFKEATGGAGNDGGGGGGGGGGAKMINNNPKARGQGCPIVFAKFKEESSSSSNGGTISISRQRSRASPAAEIDLLPQVSPEESSQPPDHPRSSLQNENERTSHSDAAQEDAGERGGEGDGAARHGLEQRSDGTGTAPPVGEGEEVKDVQQASEESDTDSHEDFAPPWLRASAGKEDLDPTMKRTREMVLEWLERNERALAAGEVDDAPDISADLVHLGPGQRPEKGRKKEVEEKARKTKDVLKVGDELAVFQGKQVELVTNVEYFSEFNPPLLAVTICALLNSGGGYIYLGLDANRVVRGVRINRAERDGARQMLDTINKDYIEPSVSPTDTDIEFMGVGSRDDQRVMKLSVRTVVTNILYRVKGVDRRGFQNGIYVRTSQGHNKHVK